MRGGFPPRPAPTLSSVQSASRNGLPPRLIELCLCVRLSSLPACSPSPRPPGAQGVADRRAVPENGLIFVDVQVNGVASGDFPARHRRGHQRLRSALRRDRRCAPGPFASRSRSRGGECRRARAVNRSAGAHRSRSAGAHRAGGDRSLRSLQRHGRAPGRHIGRRTSCRASMLTLDYRRPERTRSPGEHGEDPDDANADPLPGTRPMSRRGSCSAAATSAGDFPRSTPAPTPPSNSGAPSPSPRLAMRAEPVTSAWASPAGSTIDDVARGRCGGRRRSPYPEPTGQFCRRNPAAAADAGPTYGGVIGGPAWEGLVLTLDLPRRRMWRR